MADLEIDIEVGNGQELADVLRNNKDAAVIGLRDGIYRGSWRLSRSITLVGTGGVHGADLRSTSGPVVAVDVDDLEVTVRNLALSGGRAEVGGGVSLTGFSTLLVDGCAIHRNRATQGPGGGAHAEAGTLTLRDCDLRFNTAAGGEAVASMAIATVNLVRCHVEAAPDANRAAVVVRAGAALNVEDSTLVGGNGAALRVAGTSSQRPEVKVKSSVLRGTPSVDLAATFPGKTVIENSELSSPGTGVYRPVGEVVVHGADGEG